MRRISRTMLMVGMVFAYIAIGMCLLAAIACIIVGVLPAMKEVWITVAEEGHFNNPEAFATMMMVYFIIFGVVFIFVGCMSIPTAIISSKARENHSTGLLIASIILGATCGTYFSVAGGILGLIANARERRNARRNNVIDAQ